MNNLGMGSFPLTDCSVCCECGDWCSTGLCGRTLGWLATNSGSGIGNNGLCTECDDVKTTTQDLSDWTGSFSAEDHNTARDDYNTTYGVYPGYTDAVAGTRVCSWIATDNGARPCSGDFAFDITQILIYKSNSDNLWHFYAAATVTDAYIAGDIFYYYADVVLNGTGGMQDCSTNGGISNLLTWTYIRSANGNPEPTWETCTIPTSTTIASIAGGAV